MLFRARSFFHLPRVFRKNAADHRGKNLSFVSNLILTEKVDDKLVPVKLDFIENEIFVNFKIKSENGNCRYVGNIRKIYSTDEVGTVGYVNTKNGTNWYGYVIKDGHKVGFKFYLVSSFHFGCNRSIRGESGHHFCTPDIT